LAEYTGANRVFQVAVFSVVTPCTDVVGYRRFGGPCCLHLQGESGNSTLPHHYTASQFRRWLESSSPL